MHKLLLSSYILFNKNFFDTVNKSVQLRSSISVRNSKKRQHRRGHPKDLPGNARLHETVHEKKRERRNRRRKENVTFKPLRAHKTPILIDYQLKTRELEAFLYDAVILDYRAGQDDGCRLRVVGSWYSMTGYSIAMTKGSKYKDMINRKLIEYAFSGELERTQRFWFSGTCNKQQQEENARNSQQFGFMQSSSVFILLAAGILIGIMFLICHRFYNRYLRNNLKNVWLYENRKKSKDPVKLTPDSRQVVNAFNCKNFHKLVSELIFNCN